MLTSVIGKKKNRRNNKRLEMPSMSLCKNRISIENIGMMRSKLNFGRIYSVQKLKSVSQSMGWAEGMLKVYIQNHPSDVMFMKKTNPVQATRKEQLSQRALSQRFCTTRYPTINGVTPNAGCFVANDRKSVKPASIPYRLSGLACVIAKTYPTNKKARKRVSTLPISNQYPTTP